MMSRFCITPPPNLVSSCLLGVLQHQEYRRAVGGFGGMPGSGTKDLGKFGDVCSSVVTASVPRSL